MKLEKPTFSKDTWYNEINSKICMYTVQTTVLPSVTVRHEKPTFPMRTWHNETNFCNCNRRQKNAVLPPQLSKCYTKNLPFRCAHSTMKPTSVIAIDDKNTSVLTSRLSNDIRKTYLRPLGGVIYENPTFPRRT